MSGVTVKTNLPAFKAQLQAFGFDMERKIIRAGVNAAGNVFKKRAIELAPVYSGKRRSRRGAIAGTLKRNIILFRPKGKVRGTERQSVGVRSGRQRPRKGSPAFTSILPFYWKWVEAGHRIVPRGGRVTGGRRLKALKLSRFGTTKPVEYLKRAWLQMQGAALDAFSRRVQARIDKENAKR